MNFILCVLKVLIVNLKVLFLSKYGTVFQQYTSGNSYFLFK